MFRKRRRWTEVVMFRKRRRWIFNLKLEVVRFSPYYQFSWEIKDKVKEERRERQEQQR